LIELLQVVRISRNSDIISTLELHELMSKLDLSRNVSDRNSPEDEELYSSSWKGNRQSKANYKDALKKIKDWPKDDNRKVRLLESVDNKIGLTSISFPQFNQL
jgi:hypothetical protein